MDTVYLISKLWYDPDENRNASGYSPYGYVETEEEAIEICKEVIPVSVSPYPLELENNGNPVPKYKYIEIYKMMK